MTNCMRSGDASFINQWKFKLRISPIPPVNMDQRWTTSEVLLRPNRQKSLHYLAIVTSYPIKSSHNILLNLREFVKWSRKRNSMRKIDTNNDIFLAAMLRSGGIPRTGSAYPFYGTGPELLHILKLMSNWIQSLLLSNKMNDFICQTSNKTYHHVSTVKLDVNISCGTPDLDAHAEKMGNPVVVFHDVATDCGQQMVLYGVNYLLLLLLKHNHSASNYITSVWRLKHNKSVHGHLIFITQRIIMSYRKWKKNYH